MNIPRNDQYSISSPRRFTPGDGNIMERTHRPPTLVNGDTTTNHQHRENREQRIATHNISSNPAFSTRPLSLDSAIAPLLRRPTAPFDKSERKRAHTSAVYYSECFLRGIEPVVADTASEDAQKQYDKWWVKATNHPEGPHHQKHFDQGCAAVGRSSFEQQVKVSPLHPEGVPSTPHNSEHVSKFRRLSSEGSAAAVTLDGDESVANRTNNSQGSFVSIGDTVPVHNISTIPRMSHHQIHAIKMKLYKSLKDAGGSTADPEFLRWFEVLQTYYKSKSWDGRRSHKDSAPFFLEGQWLTLSKPTYNECQGLTPKGEYLYSLGRLAFDMFKPTGLVCSLQAVFNSVRPMNPRKPSRPLHVPRKLMKEINSGQVHLRTYDIVVAFTIEGGQTREGIKAADAASTDYIIPKPIKGILTNQGYVVPDPDTPNRLSIWFSGGSLEVQDEEKDLEEWKRIFDVSLLPNRNLKEYANILAAKLLLGALVPEGIEADGTMSFSLKRPIGGHGSAFVDIAYMDDDLRIMRGHQGSLYVCTRVPESGDGR